MEPDGLDYAYHGTVKKRLKSIARSGLRPKHQPPEHREEERAIKRAAIFFSPTEEMARNWGGVVVRFPWPENYEEDYWGDTIQLPNGIIVRSSNYMLDAVPPEYIEVKIRNRWVPIREWLRQHKTRDR